MELYHLLRILISRKILFASITSEKAVCIFLIATSLYVWESNAEYTTP